LFGSRKMADGKINRENARDLFANIRIFLANL
jgi:hypothetical protein